MRWILTASSISLLSITAASSPVKSPSPTKLPIVDLGYELYQASSYDSSNDAYHFDNVRYAQAPVNDLRFRSPLPPLENRGTVQNGSVARFCAQGAPEWEDLAIVPLVEFTSTQQPFDVKAWEAALANSSDPGIDWNAGTTEDCLFLDVRVPRKIFEQGSACSETPENKAPVLVWIHGGGFAQGSKTGYPGYEYDPQNLLNYADANNGEGMIYVSINYRLGALGFLSGPEVERDGNQNAGLRDQRLALEWVQQHIHLFGGCASRVTVMGESGGASSIMFQLAAYGGSKGPAPFSKAIAQSPAIGPLMLPSPQGYQGFLSRLNVTTLAEARAASSEAIIQANANNIQAAPYNSFLYTPVIDDFVPGTPYELSEKGAFDKSVSVLASYNSFEASIFIDPFVKSDAQLQQWMIDTFPGLSAKNLKHTMDVIYPPNFDGSLGYIDQGTRLGAMVAESTIECQKLILNDYFGSSSYSYEFSVTPGFHIQDTSYTFLDHTAQGPVPFPKAKVSLQRAIVSFVTSKTPILYTDAGAQPFPAWDAKSQKLVNITGDGGMIGAGTANRTRCEWWQQGVFQ